MTSDDIKRADPFHYPRGNEVLWLKEIAYQLAVMNERNEAVELMRQKLSGKYGNG